MQKFVVPQFIDVEDKIIGPITTRQFIMGTVAAFFIFLSYKFADFGLFLIEAILIVGVYILVGFVKVNGQSFHMFLASVFKSIMSDQVRAWNKIPSSSISKQKQTSSQDDNRGYVPPKQIPKSQELSSLSLLVDTGGRYRPEEIFKKEKINKV